MSQFESENAEFDEASLADMIRQAADCRVEPRPRHVKMVRRKIQSRMTRAWRIDRRWCLVLSLATAAGLIALLSYRALDPRDPWDQVVRRVRPMPWIHAVAKQADGSEEELWLSSGNAITAHKSPAGIRFEDRQARVRHEYDFAFGELIRLPCPDEQLDDGAELLALFGDKTFGEIEIVENAHRSIERDGRSLVEYELRVQRGRRESLLTIDVDAESSLPVSIDVRHAAGGAQSPRRYHLSFPAEGPADVFALGVPDGTTIQDRVPAGDLAAILQAMRKSREHPHAYFVAARQAESPRHFVWRKGNRWRVAQCLAATTQRLTPNSATAAEWQSGFAHAPILYCDGQNIFENDVVSPDAEARRWKKAPAVPPGQHAEPHSFAKGHRSMPELHAYPMIGPSSQFELTCDANSDEGPANTILLTVQATRDWGPDVYHRARYWVDPARGHAVVRYELTKALADKADPESVTDAAPEIYELADFVQSPQGIWYPRELRRKDAIQETAANGETIRNDEITRFHFDFAADLPDNLFAEN